MGVHSLGKGRREQSRAACYHDNRQQRICVRNRKISSHSGKIPIKSLPFLQFNEWKFNLLFERLSARWSLAFSSHQQLIHPCSNYKFCVLQHFSHPSEGILEFNGSCKSDVNVRKNFSRKKSLCVVQNFALPL